MTLSREQVRDELQALARMLSSESAEVTGCNEEEPEACVAPFLTSILKSTELKPNRATLAALRKVGWLAAVVPRRDVMLCALEFMDLRPSYAKAIADELGRAGSGAWLDLLVELGLDIRRAADTRAAVLSVFAETAGPRSAEMLKGIISTPDESPVVLACAVTSLVHVSMVDSSIDVVTLLLGVLPSASTDVQAAICRGIVKLGARAAAAQLTPLLNAVALTSSGERVAAIAARAIKDLKN